jgi:hypothetical protein
MQNIPEQNPPAKEKQKQTASKDAKGYEKNQQKYTHAPKNMKKKKETQ